MGIVEQLSKHLIVITRAIHPNAISHVLIFGILVDINLFNIFTNENNVDWAAFFLKCRSAIYKQFQSF